MSRGVWAILDHYSSTIENPRHSNCPAGESSWCSYQRDLALGTNNHRPIKNPLRPAVREVMVPVFERLASKSFLEGCVKCYTQNTNESVHHVIWSMAPKSEYSSPEETSLAVSLAVCQFNSGFAYTAANMFKLLGIPFTPAMHEAWLEIDNKRIKQSDRRCPDEVKLRRKTLKKDRIQ